MHFGKFFRDITGEPPFPYQVRFTESVQLPQLLEAPTGAGKTATVVLGWLWRRQYGSAALKEGTPRRLVFCLPVRTLVEQTAAVARHWLETAGLTDDVQVHVLMGGDVDDGWDVHPERDAILVGTQDQLLSRAMLRGYAMSRYRWPMHFGLLHNDCLWAVDETQLMGVGLSTTVQLDAFRRILGVWRPTRTLWMSATLDRGAMTTVDARPDAWTTLSIDATDRADSRLARRIQAPKPIAPAVSAPEGHKPPQIAAYATALAREVAEAHTPGTRTLVVVNNVRRAQALFRALRNEKSAETDVGLLHSRYRPAERSPRQRAVLAPDWVGILVSTQVVEAGVDISARLLFTELAPWASMVQRIGRCNRRGEYTQAEAAVRWVALEADAVPELAAPYEPTELVAARERLSRLDDAGIASLERIVVDGASPALPVLRRRDLLQLFDTEPDLTGADLDISRYIRDAASDDVQIAWRSWNGEGAPPKDSPAPTRDELCAVSLHELRDFLGRTKARAWRWDGAEGEWVEARRPVPGVVLLLRMKDGGYDAELGWTGDPAHQAPGLALSAILPDSDDTDAQRGRSGAFETLADHTNAVCQQLAAILAHEPPDPIADTLRLAARWHDAGKAHAVFQQAAAAPLAADDPRRMQVWAKSDYFAPYERRHFRHELASALALLAHGGGDLAAYLVAAHHGKLRAVLRARPTEPRPPAEVARWALGIYEGDVLRAADLGDGTSLPETRLSLDVMELGGGASGRSWQDRVLGLLEEYGPFRLTYWETLLRAADNRASAASGLSSDASPRGTAEAEGAHA